MNKKNKTLKKVKWSNNTNKPLVSSEFINMSNNAVKYRKSVPRSRNLSTDNDNIDMSNLYKNGRVSNSYNNELNRSRKIKAHRNAILGQQNRKKSNSIWNNLRGNLGNNSKTNIVPKRSSKRRRPNNWNNNEDNNVKM